MLMEGLGVHGEMRCRARIILILAFAKWQISGGGVLRWLELLEGFYAKILSPYVRSERRVSLLSVKEEEHFSLPKSNPRSPPSHSLPLPVESRPEPRARLATAHHHGRAQPRAARAAAAQPRDRGKSRPRVGLVLSEEPPIGRRRGERAGIWLFCKGK